MSITGTGLGGVTGSRRKNGPCGNKFSPTDGKEARLSFAPTRTDSGYQAHLAGLGFDLASNVKAGENSGRKLSHDFVVLWVQKAATLAESSEVKFKIDNSKPDKIGALAAWITRANNPTPIQATGGWLAK